MAEMQEMWPGTLPLTLKHGSAKSLGSRLGTPCRTTCQPASESHQPCNAALAAVALWTGQTQNLHARHHLTKP